MIKGRVEVYHHGCGHARRSGSTSWWFKLTVQVVSMSRPRESAANVGCMSRPCKSSAHVSRASHPCESSPWDICASWPRKLCGQLAWVVHASRPREAVLRGPKKRCIQLQIATLPKIWKLETLWHNQWEALQKFFRPVTNFYQIHLEKGRKSHGKRHGTYQVNATATSQDLMPPFEFLLRFFMNG